MRNYADADHLHARVCALKSRLLTHADYARLIRETLAGNVSGRDSVLHREKIFREQITPVMALVQAYDRYAPLFLAFLRQYEVQNVKMLVVQAHGEQTMQQWYDISPFAAVDKEVLEKNLSFDELRKIFSATYLSPAFERLASSVSMSVRLDILAAEHLYDAGGALSGEDQKNFRKIALERLDILAALWSYRLREYYAAGDEHVRSFVEKMKRMASGPKMPGDWQAEDLNRYLEQQLKSTGHKPAPYQIEQHLEKKFFDRMSSLFHRDFHSIYCVGAYLWLLFYQIRNVFRILDGQRFGWSSERLLDDLICKI